MQDLQRGNMCCLLCIVCKNESDMHGDVNLRAKVRFIIIKVFKQKIKITCLSELILYLRMVNNF